MRKSVRHKITGHLYKVAMERGSIVQVEAPKGVAPSFCEDCRSNPVHSGYPCFFPIFKKEDVIFIEEGEEPSLRQEIIDNLKEARECLARAERAGLDDHLAVGIADRIELMILRLEDKAEDRRQTASLKEDRQKH